GRPPGTPGRRCRLGVSHPGVRHPHRRGGPGPQRSPTPAHRRPPMSQPAAEPAEPVEPVEPVAELEEAVAPEGTDELEPYDALLLFSFGGPEGPEEVMPFLRRVTA